LSGAIGQFALAFGPALFGLLRDATGDYRAVLAACAACQIAAAAMVVRPWPIPPRGTPR
jgi:cyanate permease